MEQLTGMERALQELNLEETDRVPVIGGLVRHPKFLAEVAGVSDYWSDPEGVAFEAYRRLGCDVILGPVLAKPPDSVTRDLSGRPTGFTKATYGEKYDSPEAVAAYARGLPRRADLRKSFDSAAAYAAFAATVRQGQANAGDLLFMPNTLSSAPTFHSAREFGYENFFMATALYSQEMIRLYEHWGEQARLRNEALADAIVKEGFPRVMWIGADLCGRDGPLVSPAFLERSYFPALRYAIEPLKAADIKLIWHADANYRLIIDRLIELGMDGFQGFYESPGGMSLEAMAAKRTASGRKLIFFGSVSTTSVLPQGTPDDVRREVERCIDAAAPGGGLFINSTSSVGPEVPKENLYAMFEHALCYGSRARKRLKRE